RYSGAGRSAELLYAAAQPSRPGRRGTDRPAVRRTAGGSADRPQGVEAVRGTGCEVGEGLGLGKGRAVRVKRRRGPDLDAVGAAGGGQRHAHAHSGGSAAADRLPGGGESGRTSDGQGPPALLQQTLVG